MICGITEQSDWRVGADVKELMWRMGHSSTCAVMIYLHATDARDHEIAGQLDGLIQRDHPPASSPEQEAPDGDPDRT